MKTANIYAGIVKMDENADGTLTVFGKATDDSLDIDQQICDPVWLDKAMPEWFMTGGNIREQHSNIAAGVAEEYEKKSDGHYITALVVDPVSVKKVKARVLKGFSIGIKSPRVVRDTKAVNGRIVDGQIVEVSLVDRPANPNAKLILAKSAAGQKDLVKTEELVEKHGDHDQSDHNPHGGGSGNSEKPSGPKNGRDSAKDKEIQDEIKEHKSDMADLRADLIDHGHEKEEIRAGARASKELDRAEQRINAAREAKTPADHQAALTQALEHYDNAMDALGRIDSGDAGDIQDRIAESYSRIDDYLANLDPDHEPYMGRSATINNEVGKSTKSATKRALRKHGDHDQSDHNPHGGGGSSDNTSSERAQASINHEEVEGLAESAEDVQTEIEDYLDDLEEARVHEDENAETEGRIVERAQNSFNEAQDLVDQALDIDDAVRHQETIESATIKLEEAIDTLSYGNGETRGLQSGMREMLQGLNLYLSGFDKSATGKEPSMRERKTRVRKSALKKEAEGMPMNGEAKAVPSREEMTERYASARKALDEVTRMCKEYGYGDIEKQYGETAEEETAEGPAVGAETAEEEVGEARGEKPLDKEVVVEPNEMADKSTTKCLECGCNMVGNNHGGGTVTLPDGTTANMTSADMVTEKSTITPLPTIETVGTQIEEEDSDESDSTDKSLLADVNLNDIIEKAVKSAMTAVKAQVAELKSAKEAVENKASQLETELATAKSLAIGGGPKRTTIATGAKTNNELLAKAESYRAKAATTSDPILAKGYRDLAKDFASKAVEAESK